MPKLTDQDRICQALIILGYKEVQGRTSKYRVFPLKNEKAGNLYVGKNGALRQGKNIADSFSVSDWNKTALLNKAAAILEEKK